MKEFRGGYNYRAYVDSRDPFFSFQDIFDFPVMLLINIALKKRLITPG